MDNNYNNNIKTSCGIICYKDKTAELLMVQRKCSYSYTEFVIGKYDILDEHYIKRMIKNMTYNEQQLLLTNNFKKIWNDMWNIKNNKKTKKENRSSFYKAMIKFNILRNGYFNEETKRFINIKNMINRNKIYYKYPEWFFPKGKPDFGETELECAKREFEEETTINLKNIDVDENNKLIEMHKGINDKIYKTIFYIAKYNGNKKIIDFHNSEIGKVEWVTLDKIKDYFRDYETHKLKLLNDIISKIY